MKIKFDRKKILDFLKKGTILTLAVGITGSFAGCSSDSTDALGGEVTSSVEMQFDGMEEDKASLDEITFEESVDQAVSAADDEEEVSSLTKDFVVVNNDVEVTELYDWSQTESIIKAKDPNFWDLVFVGLDEEMGVSKNKYAVAIIGEPGAFDDCSGLTGTLEIPDSVESIDSSAFFLYSSVRL